MSDRFTEGFIETLQYYRFREFCDACREQRYIGLCYGPPGVGKTLSALHYAKTSLIQCIEGSNFGRAVHMKAVFDRNVVFHTVKVVNSPGQIRDDIQRLRQRAHYRILDELRTQRDDLLNDVRTKEKQQLDDYIESDKPADRIRHLPPVYPSFQDVASDYNQKSAAIADPTALIFVDEADRLKPNGLDQIREIFDIGGTGVVLIGMPGIEKRMARYPQLYSRIGFVHQFGPLNQTDLEFVFSRGWRPAGVNLSAASLNDKEGMAAILRITSGNFRLLDKLLAQIERILEINELQSVTADVVEAARENLVIGTV